MFATNTNADNRVVLVEKMFLTNTVRPVGFVGLRIGTSRRAGLVNIIVWILRIQSQFGLTCQICVVLK